MNQATEDTTLAITVFNGSDVFEIPASLSKPTVLYFMRASSCPQCNRHARDINRLMPEITQHGLDALVIVPEDANSAAKVKERNQTSIPVMAGNGSAHGQAGLDKKLLGLIQQSGTVVVATDGTILYKHVATNPENSFDEAEFTAFLATL